MAKGSIPADESSRKTGKRGGLGRGLGALIPTSQAESERKRERPLDVLFPERVDESSGKDDILGGLVPGSDRPRGGSARDLLSPRPRSKGKSPENVSRETPGSKRDAVDANKGESSSSSKEAASGEAVGGQAKSAPKHKKPGVKNKNSKATENELPVSVIIEDDDRHLGVQEKEDVSRETNSAEGSLLEVPGASFGMLEVLSIIPNTKQPRQIFEQSELEELAASLQEVGLLQPIVVRPIKVDGELTSALVEAIEENPDARYELIMGERRLRASQLAGLKEIPAIVRETEDENLLRDALLENLHRVQLNPLEEAAAYEQLLNDFSCTQEELATRIARSRPQIANTLRLLKLPASVQKKVAASIISAGHARALLGLSSSQQMVQLSERIINEGLSVRATEEIVRLMKGEPAKKKPNEKKIVEPSALAVRVVGRMSEYLDTRVTVSEGKTKGRIVIDFADEADLIRISQLLEK